MDLSAITFDTAATLFLLLLIGIGPKIALVPFLEKTKAFAPEEQRAIGRRMVMTAVIAAVIVFFTGAFLLRLLHITPGAVAVAGGIILALLAVRMALGTGRGGRARRRRRRAIRTSSRSIRWRCRICSIRSGSPS